MQDVRPVIPKPNSDQSDLSDLSDLSDKSDLSLPIITSISIREKSVEAMAAILK